MTISKKQKRKFTKKHKKAISSAKKMAHNVSDVIPETPKKKSALITVGKASFLGFVALHVVFLMFCATLTLATIINTINKEDIPTSST